MASVTYSIATLRNDANLGFIGGEERAPEVTSLRDGGYVIAYVTDFSGSNMVLTTFFDAQHQQLSQYTLVASYGTLNPGGVAITQLANGNVLVVWENEGAVEPGLHAQILTSGGAPVGAQIRLYGTASDQYVTPVVAALPADGGGGFVLTFEFMGNIWASRFDDAGGIIAPGYVQVNTGATDGLQTNPAVTVLSDGGWVITYQDAGGAQSNIRAAVFNADGSVRMADHSISHAGA